MHAAALRADGIQEAKLDSLAGWRLSAEFCARERSALTWTEALVNVAQLHAPDKLYEPLKEHFNDREISDLSFAIAPMSAFNPMAIAFPGAYPATGPIWVETE